MAGQSRAPNRLAIRASRSSSASSNARCSSRGSRQFRQRAFASAGSRRGRCTAHTSAQSMASASASTDAKPPASSSRDSRDAAPTPATSASVRRSRENTRLLRSGARHAATAVVLLSPWFIISLERHRDRRADLAATRRVAVQTRTQPAVFFRLKSKSVGGDVRVRGERGIFFASPFRHPEGLVDRPGRMAPSTSAKVSWSPPFASFPNPPAPRFPRRARSASASSAVAPRRLRRRGLRLHLADHRARAAAARGSPSVRPRRRRRARRGTRARAAAAAAPTRERRRRTRTPAAPRRTRAAPRRTRRRRRGRSGRAAAPRPASREVCYARSAREPDPAVSEGVTFGGRVGFRVGFRSRLSSRLRGEIPPPHAPAPPPPPRLRIVVPPRVRGGTARPRQRQCLLRERVVVHIIVAVANLGERGDVADQTLVLLVRLVAPCPPPTARWRAGRGPRNAPRRDARTSSSSDPSSSDDEPRIAPRLPDRTPAGDPSCRAPACGHLGGRRQEFICVSRQRRKRPSVRSEKENAGWRFPNKASSTVESIERGCSLRRRFPCGSGKKPTDCLIIRHSLLLTFSTVPLKKSTTTNQNSRTAEARASRRARQPAALFLSSVFASLAHTLGCAGSCGRLGSERARCAGTSAAGRASPRG